MTLHLVKQKNASEVLSFLRAMIEDGQVSGDGRLPTERELSDRFGVGRRVLRTALDALEAEGLIWRKQGKGTFIGQPPDPNGQLAAGIRDSTDPISYMEARLCVEPDLAALCATRATEQDVARLRVLANRTAEAPDAESAELWDGSLHRLIARVAGNPILMTAFMVVDDVRSNSRWQDERERARSPDLLRLYTRQHGLIVDAIAAGEPDVARAAMRAHLESVSQNLAQSLRDARR
ncbi:MAG: FadR/GntR family transcriptional regulator [Pseudomonadota bacterium]